MYYYTAQCEKNRRATFLRISASKQSQRGNLPSFETDRLKRKQTGGHLFLFKTI